MTMVERVARAIYEGRNGPRCMAWSRHSNEHRRPYIDDARAAIEAMREPTEEMLFAADWLENGTRAAWQAMIDAALSEQKP